MERQIVFLLIALSACRASFGQSAVRSYEPEKLARQLIDFKHGVESGAGRAVLSETHETIGDLGILGKRLGEQLQIGGTVEGCDDFSVVRLRLDGVHDAGFVRMQCGWDLDLVVSHRTGQGWLYLQTVIIPNKYEEARTTVAAVTGDNSQQVIVHKVQYMSGTGLSQQNFLIYKLKDGKLIPVLNVVESGHLTPPWTDHEVSQESGFDFIPASQEAAKGWDSAATFDETQVLDFAGLRVELKRQHIWSTKNQVFLESQWYSARPLESATPKSPQK